MPANVYDAFEIQPGACLEQVEMICRHLTDGGSFGGQSAADAVDVESMISATYYKMVAIMAKYFISWDQTDKKILGLLQHYNAIGASARVELAMASAGFKPVENTRFMFLWKEFEDDFEALVASNALSVMGATPLSDPRGDGLTAGGISVEDKKIIGDDPDANNYSFRRKSFDNPQVSITPAGDSIQELP